jgi:hypothetical protein
MWFRFTSTGQMRFITVFYCLQADMYSFFFTIREMYQGSIGGLDGFTAEDHLIYLLVLSFKLLVVTWLQIERSVFLT